MAITILISALAVCGIFLVAWALTEAYVMKLPPESVHIFYLRGSDAEIEQKLRACLWMRSRHGLRGKMIFVDCGLSVHSQITAQLMLDEGCILCSEEQLFEYIREE
jgi:hypothetical protein